MGLIAPDDGLPRGAAGRVRPRRRPADLRRGHHRVPRRPRRRAGAVRRPRRPDVLRQGHRRRSQHRRVRRSGRRSWTRWRPTVRCSRRAPCRATRWPPPPVGPPSTCSTTPPTTSCARTAARLADRLEKAFAERGHRRRGPAGVDAGRPPLRDRPRRRTYDEARTTDVERYRRFFHAALDRGVAMAPGAYEVLFPGLAHTDEVIDDIGDRFDEAAAASDRRSRPA